MRRLGTIFVTFLSRLPISHASLLVGRGRRMILQFWSLNSNDTIWMVACRFRKKRENFSHEQNEFANFHPIYGATIEFTSKMCNVALNIHYANAHNYLSRISYFHWAWHGCVQCRMCRHSDEINSPLLARASVYIPTYIHFDCIYLLVQHFISLPLAYWIDGATVQNVKSTNDRRRNRLNKLNLYTMKWVRAFYWLIGIKSLAISTWKSMPWKFYSNGILSNWNFGGFFFDETQMFCAMRLNCVRLR